MIDWKVRVAPMGATITGTVGEGEGQRYAAFAIEGEFLNEENLLSAMKAIEGHLLYPVTS